MTEQPNILFIMADQMRWDCIHALGNTDIYTPNLDRLVARGVTCTRAYSPAPVCVPARYVIRTGRSPLTTGFFQNEKPQATGSVEERCGEYLARAMRRRGYRTFGIGKFHTMPLEEDLGYDVYQRCEEIDGFPDAYARFINSQPAYAHIEQLHGERTEMYYQPQMSPLPAALTSEAWCADRAVEQIGQNDDRPFFGLVSFVGPHPPLAPPIPYNRMYDPDRMRNPRLGPADVDFMDPRVRWNSYFVFAEDFSEAHFRTLRARYYGEITYIDNCIGRILDAVEARPDGDNSVICFFSDHGEFLGDHHAVQKENFFEESAHIPFLVSWPRQLAVGNSCDALTSLEDLFGLATAAAGDAELRDGCDLLSILQGNTGARETLFGFTSAPGDLNFRIMARQGDWKYIFHANGGGELLFHLSDDPHEHCNRAATESDVRLKLRAACAQRLAAGGGSGALDELGDLRSFPRTELTLERCYQMNRYRGVRSFPAHPREVVHG